MDLSIIIVNYNSFPLTRHCIKSIFEQKLKEKYEIIVVDNNSENRNDEYFQDDFPNVTLIECNSNQGFAKAVNKGIEKSQGKYILLLNPDIVVLSQSIQNLYRFLEENSDVAVVGPRIISPNGELQESCRRFITPKIIFYRRTWLGKFYFAKSAVRDNLMLDWDHNNSRNVDWIMGSSMMVRKKAINHIGPMDEQFFMYMEDMDWCRRFWESGWRVCYAPSSEMVHYYQRMSGQQLGFQALMFNKLARIHFISGLKYFWKYSVKRSTILKRV